MQRSHVVATKLFVYPLLTIIIAMIVSAVGEKPFITRESLQGHCCCYRYHGGYQEPCRKDMDSIYFFYIQLNFEPCSATPR